MHSHIHLSRVRNNKIWKSNERLISLIIDLDEWSVFFLITISSIEKAIDFLLCSLYIRWKPTGSSHSMINLSNSYVYSGWIITIFFSFLAFRWNSYLFSHSTSLLFILDNALRCFLPLSFSSSPLFCFLPLLTGCTEMVHITHAYEYMNVLSREHREGEKKKYTREASLCRD